MYYHGLIHILKIYKIQKKDVKYYSYKLYLNNNYNYHKLLYLKIKKLYKNKNKDRKY